MKEALTKVIDMLTREDSHRALQKLLERYNKCIAAGRDYFEGDKSSLCVPLIKMPIRKKAWNVFNDPRIYVNIYRSVYTKVKVTLATVVEVDRAISKDMQPNNKLMIYYRDIWDRSFKIHPLRYNQISVFIVIKSTFKTCNHF